jgi:hypothetical protein
MRNLLLAGTAGLFLALGASGAYAVPPNSPYATMVPPGAVDGAPPYDEPVYGDGDAGPMIEGRAAYVDPGYAYGAPDYDDPGYGYDAAPVGGFWFGGGHHFGGHIHHGR